MLFVFKRPRVVKRFGLGFGVAVAAITAACMPVSAAVVVTNISEALAAQGYGATFGAVPQGINDLGQVVGYYNNSSANGTQVPFVFTPGTGAGTGVVALTQITPGFTTQAAAINNNGLVVGSGTVGGNINGFVYNTATGNFTSLAPASVTGNGSNTVTKTYLNAVNNNGAAVGYVGYDSTNVGTRAYRGLTYNTATNTGTDIGSAFSGVVVSGNSTANQNILLGINDAGVIAGYGPNTGGASGTATANNTQIIFKATPKGDGSYTYTNISAAILAVPLSQYDNVTGGYIGIDSLGYVAGTYKTLSTTTRRGYLYNSATGTAVVIDLNNSNKANVTAFADVGGVPVVGGQAFTTSNRAFIFKDGITTDITNALAGTPYSSYLLTSVNGINVNGDIVATGSLSSAGVPTTFLLTGFIPVPEPTWVAPLSAGAFGLLRRRRGARAYPG